MSKIRTMKNQKVTDVFRAFFFWDADLDTLSFEEDKEYIIERVLARSLWLEEDFQKLEQLYDKDLIIDLAINSIQIFGNEQIEEIAQHYNLQPTQFVRYIKDLN